MAVDAIDRDQMHIKLYRMLDRSKQRRDGAYKCGYRDACKDALMKLDECQSIETTAVTRCKECKHATERTTTLPYCLMQNRRKDPDDYCRFSEPDEY